MTSAVRSPTPTPFIAATRPSSVPSPRGQTPSSSSDASATLGRTMPCCRPTAPVPPSTSGLPAWRPSPASRPRRSAWRAPPAMAPWRRPPLARHADVGFYQFAAGEYARLAGDAASARQGYAAALAVARHRPRRPGRARADRRLRGAHERRHRRAREGGRHRPAARDAGLLGDLQAATGDAAAASRQFETVRFIERLGEIASTVYDRALIRFEARPRSASDALLAKAQHRSPGAPTPPVTTRSPGRCIGSADTTPAAARSRPPRPTVPPTRGSVPSRRDRARRGDAAGGRPALQAALALGPALDPIERAEAQRLLAD